MAQFMRTENPAKQAMDMLREIDLEDALRARGPDGRGALIADELRAWAADLGLKVVHHDKPVAV